ncbi:nucleotidyltransferase domain-containing protein [Paenibacillus kobensis]|uniref:nucleotidyltransferase domain-containing protein n=1 Tax=Paenibacillus kobensis TaxID=59841 RepID=UPI000FD8992B|nr:nucleotidyltransferase domain-containing protein [Paenibacillus kobensis]
MNDTLRLMEAAKNYVEANRQPDWIMAYAGGSVGRGDADSYSDLDLNIVVSSPIQRKSMNITFEHCDIQLHVHSWNGSDAMRAAPWQNRFLSEARTVYDPHNVLGMLKPAAVDYFRSNEGRSRMLKQAHDEVEQYLQRLDSCLRYDELVGASLAVQGAWHAAAASFVWMNCECCSGDALLGHIRSKQPKVYEAYRSIALNQTTTAAEMLKALSFYRDYLRSTASSDNFALDSVMDQHIARKVERLAASKDTDGVRLLIRCEAMLCYAAAGGKIEQFGRQYREYPAPVQEALASLGCAAYTSTQISELLHQVEQLTESAQQAV